MANATTTEPLEPALGDEHALPQHGEPTAAVEHGGGHAEPAKAFGFIDAPMFISIAMLAVFALLIWKKVPAAIGKALDKKIGAIREQLAEAEALRKEAEAIRSEYAAKAAAAEGEAAAILERARHEADGIVAKAKQDAEALVERRSRMAEEKIAAEERAAVDQLRAAAADAARVAAARLIAERHDAAADEKLIDEAIGGLGR
jgi:F-type H+-transporting ATPase subunit b